MKSYRKIAAALMAGGALLAGTAHADQSGERANASGNRVTAAQADSCERGKLRGYALVYGAATTPDEWSAGTSYIINRYDCAGYSENVAVRRIGVGRYRVKFRYDNPASVAVATARDDSEVNVAVSKLPGAGEWGIQVLDVAGGDANQWQDAPFFITVM
jgi:hypothetical protein